MNDTAKTDLSDLPSVHFLLEQDVVADLIVDHGRDLVTDSIRETLQSLRDEIPVAKKSPDISTAAIIRRLARRLDQISQPSLRPVFNLTGTVLHTNLGRAPLPAEAIEAMSRVAAGASNLEFDLGRGKRGDRDDHLESLVCRLTGAEAATVVNNNAAAVLLTLNSLANRKEVAVSRGELIEIGGAFRIPDIMARAGCKLHEVGTTNRTHLKDFAAAISPKSAMLMKVHTSNYEVQGFTAEVPEHDLATLAHEHDLSFVVDLGSGTLADLTRFGLPAEPTPNQSFADGADVVTFSGDKLLGGPQCGIIAGRADLIAKIKKNPMKRALRVDKMTIAALEAIFRLYLNPDHLAQKIPALRLLSRPQEEIRAMANSLVPHLAAALDGEAEVSVIDSFSQIGSGALPVDTLPSAALAISPTSGGSVGRQLKRLAAAFRALPVPVIGRIHEDQLLFDIRCLEDSTIFVEQLSSLNNS
ncbi:MAG: L-seryl-tRNA(Sec) selenium transferase [Alphaproteobacteria bacterium]|jgi:L-seryl-tRNA(Ser) seleniumtransferase|nr:L-seryl-tRNA(Sec) selenium transferase [Alphaproteobacteria bacterium]MBT4019354.1 L-seryl-tRNA(Sec) selenium transferase [Alphaproteobacteria bacterium]MBT4966680.1 L-seryl-tRNA(Sec) selenium transferase [Alphaproteobacteria bacterium]MBT5161956.1 L-seryl-tRNA(Sec) selenium transferase [Alphaproteobacteria bacterium]MBT6385612.1 L-seryl-tRNA(Sec) selenium transferase [Alphaproteobacteria bacterium]